MASRTSIRPNKSQESAPRRSCLSSVVQRWPDFHVSNRNIEIWPTLNYRTRRSSKPVPNRRTPMRTWPPRDRGDRDRDHSDIWPTSLEKLETKMTSKRHAGVTRLYRTQLRCPRRDSAGGPYGTHIYIHIYMYIYMYNIYIYTQYIYIYAKTVTVFLPGTPPLE